MLAQAGGPLMGRQALAEELWRVARRYPPNLATAKTILRGGQHRRDTAKANQQAGEGGGTSENLSGHVGGNQMNATTTREVGTDDAGTNQTSTLRASHRGGGDADAKTDVRRTSSSSPVAAWMRLARCGRVYFTSLSTFSLTAAAAANATRVFTSPSRYIAPFAACDEAYVQWQHLPRPVMVY